MTAARRGRKRESLLPREETRRSPAEEAGQAARSGEQKEAMLSRHSGNEKNKKAMEPHGNHGLRGYCPCARESRSYTALRVFI